LLRGAPAFGACRRRGLASQAIAHADHRHEYCRQNVLEFCRQAHLKSGQDQPLLRAAMMLHCRVVGMACGDRDLPQRYLVQPMLAKQALRRD
jgi:hypothetical protein